MTSTRACAACRRSAWLSPSTPRTTPCCGSATCSCATPRTRPRSSTPGGQPRPQQRPWPAVRRRRTRHWPSSPPPRPVRCATRGDRPVLLAADQANKSGANAEALELWAGRSSPAGLPAGIERDTTEIGCGSCGCCAPARSRGTGRGGGEDTLAVEELGRAIPPSLDRTAFIVVWSLCSSRASRRAAKLVEALSATRRGARAGPLQPDVASMAGYQAFYEGVWRGQRAVRAAIAHQGDPLPTWPLPNDPLVATMVGSACVSALEGDREQAERWSGPPPNGPRRNPFPRGLSLGFTYVYGGDAHGDRRSGRRPPVGAGDRRGGPGPRLPVLHRTRRVYMDPSTPAAPADHQPCDGASRLLAGLGQRSMWASMDGEPGLGNGHNGRPREAMTRLDAAEEASSDPGERTGLAGGCRPGPRPRR